MTFLKKAHQKCMTILRLSILRPFANYPKPLKYLIAILNPAFHHHNLVTLEGISTHLTQTKAATGNRFRLRRYVHMLEKAFSHKELKPVFASNYILPAAKSYEQALNSDRNSEEVQWAHDVIERYFEHVANSPDQKIEQARAIFKKTNQLLKNKGYAPFVRKPRPAEPTIEHFQKLCNYRRSVRFYERRTVERDKIDKAVECALQAPSACNRQPFKFIFLDDPNLVSEVANLPPGAQTYSHNIPVMCVIVGDLSAYEFEKDRHIIHIDGSLAAMNLILALETQGISSCCINWPDIKDLNKQANQLLKLEPYERIVMMISLGYPDKAIAVPFSQKGSLTEKRFYNV